jgi:predicted deacetylase
MQKIVMDADDFRVKISPEILANLKDHFPKFRITLFTVPYDKSLFQDKPQWDKYEEWAEYMKEEDWIEIAVHGLTHEEHEFECSYEEAEQKLIQAESIFNRAGVKYSKIFRPPYWQISPEALQAVKNRGYIIASHPKWQLPNDPTLKTYTYNHSWEEPWPNWPIVKSHGHMTPGSGNGVVECYENMLKMPQEAKFLTIGEFLKTWGNK